MDKDTLFLQKALKEKYLTQSQVLECLDIGNKSLKDFLREKGYMTEEQINKIEEDLKNLELKEPEHRPEDIGDTTDKDSQKKKTLFGKAAILLKMATQEQVNDALLIQITDKPDKKIGEIMVEKGYLTPQQVQTILKRQYTQVMVCPKCNKKYQIVLYQKGRSYKCKECKIELEEIEKASKKTKKKAKEEKIQLMGLTQEITRIPRKTRKEEEFKIDFLPEEEVKKEEMNTEEILKEAGINVDYFIKDYILRPKVKKRKSYSNVVGIIILLIIVFIAFSFISSNEKKRKKEEKNINKVSKKIKKNKVNRLKRDYDKLENLIIDENDENSLRKAINSYQKFLKKYPDCEYSFRIKERLTYLSDVLSELIKKNRFLKTQKKIYSLLERNKVIKAYQTFNLITEDDIPEDLYNEYENIKKKLMNFIEKELDKLLNNVKTFLKKEDYKKALLLLKKSSLNNIKFCKDKIEQEKRIIKEKIEGKNNIKILNKIIEKLIGYLINRDYQKCFFIIEEEKLYLNNESTKREILKLKNNIYLQNKIGKVLNSILKEKKNKKIKITILKNDRKKQKINMFVLSYNPKSELIMGKIGNTYKGIKISDITIESIKRILKKHISLKDKENKIAFGCFLIPYKNIKILYKKFPILKENELFNLLYLHYVKYLIKNKKNIKKFLKIFPYVIKYYNNKDIFKLNEKDFRILLFNCATFFRKKRNYYSQKLFNVIINYFPASYEAKKSIKLIKKH